ncbi:DgyrCDS6249 [Dimorphilus gyrociliatus]|uniref:DgyrCDS6249 n=1 Tax=Dimorphilus gyrociliatus TaxID=2664684 RepID=A0A7I8VP36_9ANNE|nr:DgyrCDS6249 [Dimorphilus gyrociliatus]
MGGAVPSCLKNHHEVSPQGSFQTVPNTFELISLPSIRPIFFCVEDSKEVTALISSTTAVINENDIIIDKFDKYVEIHVIIRDSEDTVEKPYSVTIHRDFYDNFTIQTVKQHIFVKENHTSLELDVIDIRFKKKETTTKKRKTEPPLPLCMSLDDSDEWNFSDLDFKAYTPVPYSLRHNDDRVKNGQVFNVIIKMYPDFDRSFTNNFLNADIGERLKVSNFSGTFDIRVIKNAEKIYMLAGGTGFTPLASIIHYCFNFQQQTIMNLMYFNKRERDIIWKYQLDQMNHEVENFNVVYVLTEEENWTGKNGTVVNEARGWLPHDQKGVFIMACGPDSFNREIKWSG